MINLELPDLPYSKDALAPYMSAETLELHHDKHHMAYVTNGNKFIKENNFNEDSIGDIVKNSFNKSAPVFNNLFTSSKWSPVVGSSKIYNVLPVDLLDNSLDNLILCASPPERVVADCPIFI